MLTTCRKRERERKGLEQKFNPHAVVLLLLLSLTAITLGCGTQSAISSNNADPTNGQLKVSILSGQASLGVPYSAVISVSGGVAPYTFALVSGSLPPGMSLNAKTGSISGTPTAAGTYNFVISVSDSSPVKASVLYRPVSVGAPVPVPGPEYGLASEQITVSANNSYGKITISPNSLTITSQQQQQFTAQISGTASTAVTWSASAGTISSSGVYTAPKVNSNTTAVISATSIANPGLRASATLIVVPATSLAITDSTLPQANVSTPYFANLSATGGVPPYQWSLSSGSLPSGIELQTASGTITGTTATAGSYPFTAKVTDATGKTASLAFSLTVSSSSPSNFDGPAELPRVYLQTAMADTPAPGPTITVPSGGNLQTALNNAECGETIELQAGSTFTGKYTFPANSCDDQHWIIVRTSTPDANLPTEGTRMTPCYAGVASLPGRPAYSCSSPQQLLATITFAGTGLGPIIFANGANHYRLLGLEITRVAGNGKAVDDLVTPEIGGSMNWIVLDRMYIHGAPVDETRRGVHLSGGTSVAVQDSYLSDFHCTSVTGTCIDSQAISGGVGDLPGGPYRIVDNFLEAAGECILFGGGGGTTVPADMEIRLNHLFKPMSWLEGQPGFVAPAFIVKNHLELKNGQRVLFESNILEDTWGGFSQHGYSVVLTPRNANDTATGNVCTVCQVTDVTIRYVTISHVAGAFVLANPLTPPNGVALAGQRYSIHDVIADDIDRNEYVGYGDFAQVSTIQQTVLQNVLINHVTAFAPHMLFNVGGPNTVKMTGFTFTNSVVTSGNGLSSTGSFGTADCAATAYYPSSIMQACFSGYTFATNALLDSATDDPPSKWPVGNFFYSTETIDFVNYNGGNGGDYHLLPSSPAIGAASDGTNLGANVDLVLSNISGVQ